MSEFSLLNQSDLFGPSKFDIFEKELKCTITDFAILLGGYVSSIHFINDNYVDKAIKILDNLKQVSYMAKMGIAWAVCEVMCRYPNKCFEYLKVSKLDKWTYNKAISKMIESFRVSKENKEKLRQMKRK